MALINKNELKLMQKQELEDKLKELKKELMKENAQIAIGTVPKNPGKIKQIKKTIARIIFMLNQKQINTKKEKEEIKKTRR